MKNILKVMLLLVFAVFSLSVFTVEEVKAEEVSSFEIIEGGTLITESSNEVAAYALPEYTLQPTSSRSVVAPTSNNPEVEGQSTYIDPVKKEANSGEYYIQFAENSLFVEYDDSGVVSQSETMSTTYNSNNDYFIVENGYITEASNANVMTLGGVDYTAYMYQTLEDANSGVNGIPISGNAVVGKYFGTEEYNGKTYANVEISGFNGYINLYDVQIIPSCFNVSTTYYFAENGVWYYAIATDPLTSTQYEVWPISDAPSWAVEGQKYYSSDQVNFTTSEFMEVSTYADYQNEAYFQNLSFRSTTSYSGAQLQSFLKYKGFEDSEYYNATNAFVDKQEYFGINGLLMFAHANLESAYGTSTYSQRCYNFFGRGAFDSNPDNACISYGYNTPVDGIYSEAIFYNNNYLDPGYYSMDKGYSYYEGSYVGNKSGGMNVHYATDADWGSKIGSIAYECDKYLGGHDNNKYRIIELTQEAYIYTDSSLSTHVYAQGDYTYAPSSSNHDNATYFGFTQPDVGNPKVVVVAETSNAYKVQLECPVNKGSSGFETYTTADKGSYPNYNDGGTLGKSTNYVKTGYANFANEYEAMTAQQYWIPKTGTTVVANNPITNTATKPYYAPCTDTVSDTINSSGDRVVKKEATDGSRVCTSTYYGTSSTLKSYDETKYYLGYQTQVINDDYYNNGQLQSHVVDNYDPNGHYKISRYDTKYSSNGLKDEYRYYLYYSNGNIKEKGYEDWRSDVAEKTYYSKYQYDSSGKATKWWGYDYHVSGNVSLKNYKEFYSNGKTKYYSTTKVADNGKTNEIRKYYYYDSGKLKWKDYQDWDTSTGKATYYSKYQYDTKGNETNWWGYNYHSNGKVKDKRYKEFYSNGSTKYYSTKSYDSSGKLTDSYYQSY